MRRMDASFCASLSIKADSIMREFAPETAHAPNTIRVETTLNMAKMIRMVPNIVLTPDLGKNGLFDLLECKL